MKAADLKEAQSIATARQLNVTMRDRLAAGERIALTIGEGSSASAIVLLPAYLESIRADIIAALNLRIKENDAALRARGVEP